MPKNARVEDLDTPTKAQISRVYQVNGGDRVRGAATATARQFNLAPSNGASKVKYYNSQIRDGQARRLRTGGTSTFSAAKAEQISLSFTDAALQVDQRE